MLSDLESSYSRFLRISIFWYSDLCFLFGLRRNSQVEAEKDARLLRAYGNNEPKRATPLDCGYSAAFPFRQRKAMGWRNFPPVGAEPPARVKNKSGGIAPQSKERAFAVLRRPFPRADPVFHLKQAVRLHQQHHVLTTERTGQSYTSGSPGCAIPAEFMRNSG